MRNILFFLKRARPKSQSINTKQGDAKDLAKQYVPTQTY
jgi:hypothetical protein